jgi:low affinity Fe/Cu permease
MVPQYFSRTSMFGGFAKMVARAAGRPLSFMIALAIVIAWAASGPFFHYSDTWQLIINTSTTIVTLLMVFLIQNTQNREGEAIQIKLDELLRSSPRAHNALLDIEEFDEEQLMMLRKIYKELAAEAHRELDSGGNDLGCPKAKNFH